MRVSDNDDLLKLLADNKNTLVKLKSEDAICEVSHVRDELYFEYKDKYSRPGVYTYSLTRDAFHVENDGTIVLELKDHKVSSISLIVYRRAIVKQKDSWW